MEKLAVLLANESFFGANVLQQSTVTGKGKSKALDSAKMSSLLSVIHASPAFCKMSKEEFSSKVKSKVIKAIAHHCKYLRIKSNEKTLTNMA